MSPYQYRNSHSGDEAVVRPSYLHNGNFYTGKSAASYWMHPLFSAAVGNVYTLEYARTEN